MSKLSTFTSLIVTILSLSSCAYLEDIRPYGSSGSRPPKRPDLSAQRMIRNELVVKYVSGTSDSAKDSIRKRYKVKTVRQCNCADESLELWIFDADSIKGGIEEIKGHASSEPDLEGTDFQYLFDQPSALTTVSTPVEELVNLVKDENSGITIAIVDSGIDVDHSGFSGGILYNSRLNEDHCVEGELQEISGWDFVDGDNFPEDHHGHGTMVADIIVRELTANNIDFQLLPVRSFDENGQGTYFDILCGFRKASLQQDVDIINLSFGWYYEEFTLLPQFITEVEQEVLVIASSGNQGVNTDLFSHFPSSYEHANIFSIGGIDDMSTDLDSLSNFGVVSVDVVAPFRGISFVSHADSLSITGTSFSAAYATAKSAQLFQPGEPPAYQISWVLDNAVVKPALAGKVKDPKMIVP